MDIIKYRVNEYKKIQGGWILENTRGSDIRKYRVNEYKEIHGVCI